MRTRRCNNLFSESRWSQLPAKG